MGTIHIDGKEYEVRPDQSLLQASLSLGIAVPYFCWHPALGSVGACRQCAVKQFKDEKDTHGRLVMSCMTPAAPGTRISIDDPEAVAFRRQVIEGLMLNHPHDCPVCDEGGECHLQDMTELTGHSARRSRFPKRTFRNQYLGPFLNHEMNRCIQCYRCVRFYREYAGGRDLHAIGLRDVTYFGRHRDGVLENEFSGNLVEVCPTGVFTDATLKRHYTRKWDLQMAPSVCQHCGTGCNITPGERYGTVRRVLNRYHGEVNGWFLCDRGRFGYEFASSPERLRASRLLRDGQAVTLGRAEAAKELAEIVGLSSRAIGIGSPRASLEANFALRTLVGPENYFAGISEAALRLLTRMIDLLRDGPVRTPSLREVEGCDAVLVLGEDVTHSAPRLALSLRQAARRQPMAQAEPLRIPLWLDHPVRELTQGARGPLFVLTPDATPLDDAALAIGRAAPDDLARLGFAVAHELDPAAPGVPGLDGPGQALALQIALALGSAGKPLVVAGPSCGSEAILEAAGNIAFALRARNPEARLAFVAPESNSFGLALLESKGLEAAARALKAGGHDAVIVLENDLAGRVPAELVATLLEGKHQVVALDSIAHPTLSKARLALASASHFESEGTLVSAEGRAQRFFAVMPPPEGTQESWRWLRDALAAARRPEGDWRTLDEVIAAVGKAVPSLAAIPDAAPLARFRLAQQKVPRQPHRYSGRTAMYAHLDVRERKPPDDPDSPLSFSMEGYPRPAPGAVTPFFWWPGWNSVQATQWFQSEVGGPLRAGEAGVRLLSPSGAPPPYFQRVPERFAPRQGEWWLVGLQRIYGSDELSRLAPAVAQRVPKVALVLNPDDAAALGAGPEQVVTVQVDGAGLELPVTLSPSLPRGVAGLPLVVSTFQGLRLPSWVRILRGP